MPIIACKNCGMKIQVPAGGRRLCGCGTWLSGDDAPTVSDVAEHLLVKHHSAVELVDRAERAGLVERALDAHDRRVARLRLTPEGHAVLRRLTEAHLDELHRLGPVVAQLTRRRHPSTPPSEQR